MRRGELTPEQWSEAKRLFLRATALPDAEQVVFISTLGGDSPTLAAEVRSLLASEADVPVFMENPEDALGAMLPTQAGMAVEAPAPGDVIGSCRLVSLAGEGATGLVYLAEQARPRRKVAVKILRPGQGGPAALRRLEREAELLARLRHPGIAQVVEAGTGPAGPFVVLEYIEGEPITTWARGRALCVPERVKLFLRVCEAVQHAHAMGVIHRDLKPANILVTHEGEPKVLDFGVARTTDTDLTAPAGSSGQVAGVVGTLAYMSPEQAAGLGESVDTRADVYALGAILYELLAGHPPHDVAGVPLNEALEKIQHAEAERLGKVSRALRGDLEMIACKALAKNPADRYSSVSELAADVTRHLSRLPVLAHPPSAVYELSRLTSRHRALVAGIGIALAGLTGALVWSLVERHREHRDYLVVREVAGSWIADAMRDLGPVSGTYEARRQMLERVRGPLQRFARLHPADLDVQGNLAALEFAQAEVSRETGAFEAAMQGYKESHRIYSLLAKASPENVEWRLQHSVAAVKVGDIHKGREQTREAVSWYLEALKLDEVAAGDFRNDYHAQDQLVWSYERLAFMFASQRRLDDAIAYSDKTELASITLRERWPGEPKSLWCRVGSLHLRAHVLSLRGEAVLAEFVREEALNEGRKLVALVPTERMYATRHLFSLNCRVGVELAAGDVGAAELLLAEAQPLLDRALVLDGHERTAHDAAVGFYTQQSRVRMERGALDLAQLSLDMAVGHARKAWETDPTSSDAGMSLAHAMMRWADFASRYGTDGESLDSACAARETLVEVAERFPHKAVAHETLARFCIAPTHPGARDLPLALAAAKRAVDTDPSRAEPFELLALVLEATGDPEGAGEALQRAIRLLPGSDANTAGELVKQIDGLTAPRDATRR